MLIDVFLLRFLGVAPERDQYTFRHVELEIRDLAEVVKDLPEDGHVPVHILDHNRDVVRKCSDGAVRQMLLNTSEENVHNEGKNKRGERAALPYPSLDVESFE